MLFEEMAPVRRGEIWTLLELSLGGVMCQGRSTEGQITRKSAENLNEETGRVASPVRVAPDPAMCGGHRGPEVPFRKVAPNASGDSG